MDKEENINENKRKIKILKNLGFELTYPDWYDLIIDVDVGKYSKTKIDLSGVDEKLYLEYIIKQAYKEGYYDGRIDLQRDIKELLNN
ncbi:MAG: hypothetical protein EHM12_08120 [Dehalococcoidia bacterium]|nr:MAG: hypothetical protein EHM12_08120 [Dehalococcoidia bacterium]